MKKDLRIMANQQSHEPQYSTSMSKSGLSPEETKELINSHTSSVFAELQITEEVKKIIEDCKNDVIWKLSYSINKDGNMHKGRRSAELWKELGVIPAPTSDGQGAPSPLKVKEQGLDEGLTSVEESAQSYITHLSQTKDNSQMKLFTWLHKKGLLGFKCDDVKGVLLKENGERLKCVELCDALDETAKKIVCTYVSDSRAGSATGKHELQTEYEEPQRQCLIVAIFRIATAILQKDNIFSDKGYKQWKKHLWMIASFATLNIALDLFKN
ncbi:uncharacterized protein LOC114520070 [Dendronephthya gigantea]|uniref:uncharacterized protein LOC114520070 n=1 Tax=Dendronephthya gigantea TaxID=151771 RepID=UPI00106B1292|nr:uncharacterized protein LOC114520070 [Dendronephthya gigantea]